MIYVCKQDDWFTQEEAHWVVDLSNGERIWQDDNRPEIFPASAWLRLRQYLEETSADIIRMFIQFRSHIEFPLPENAEGYYFAKGSLAFLEDNSTMNLAVLGYLDNEKGYITQWDLPTLTRIGTEVRSLEQVMAGGPEHLIINRRANGILERQALLFEWGDRTRQHGNRELAY